MLDNLNYCGSGDLIRPEPFKTSIKELKDILRKYDNVSKSSRMSHRDVSRFLGLKWLEKFTGGFAAMDIVHQIETMRNCLSYLRNGIYEWECRVLSSDEIDELLGFADDHSWDLEWSLIEEQRFRQFEIDTLLMMEALLKAELDLWAEDIDQLIKWSDGSMRFGRMSVHSSAFKELISQNRDLQRHLLDRILADARLWLLGIKHELTQFKKSQES